MKKKKIKDLAKQIVKLGREYDRKRYESPRELKEDESNLDYCEYDEKVSEKFSKFVLNLIKIKDKISIDLFEHSFNIHCDINRFKNSNKNYTENTFDIKVDKFGFRLRRNYSNYTSYKDSNMFELLKEQIIEKNKIVSKELILETVDDLTVELNLSRDNNLEEILK